MARVYLETCTVTMMLVFCLTFTDHAEAMVSMSWSEQMKSHVETRSGPPFDYDIGDLETHTEMFTVKCGAEVESSLAIVLSFLGIQPSFSCRCRVLRPRQSSYSNIVACSLRQFNSPLVELDGVCIRYREHLPAQSSRTLLRPLLRDYRL